VLVVLTLVVAALVRSSHGARPGDGQPGNNR